MLPFIQSLKKAGADLRANGFMNLVTIVIIALSIFMVGVLMLLFDNAARLMDAWAGDNRVMVYMKPDIAETDLPGIREQLRSLGKDQIREIRVIPNTKALEDLAEKFSGHEDTFHSFRENPLPHAMEVTIASGKGSIDMEELTAMVNEIETLDFVESVLYAQGVMERFSFIFSLITRTGYFLCGLFSLICMFITANTVRLSLHSREIEVQILRLVGATEQFIKSPFYLAGALQGFFGGLLGLGMLCCLYNGLLAACSHGLGSPFSLALAVSFPFHFLSVLHILILLLGSTFLGWSGCYLSLRRMTR